jgi:hypothetical protein
LISTYPSGSAPEGLDIPWNIGVRAQDGGFLPSRSRFLSSGINGAKGFIGSYLARHIITRKPDGLRLLVRNTTDFDSPDLPNDALVNRVPLLNLIDAIQRKNLPLSIG